MVSPKSKFHADLAVGEKGERHVATTLKKHYGAQSISRIGACKGFDFRLVYSDKTELFEVKTDFKSRTTGNIFFEYFCNKKPSGLTSTQADKWAVLLPHLQLILVFTPAKMLKFLQTSKKAKDINGGDRNAVSGYVISIENIKALADVEQIPTNTRLTHKEKLS